jgi:hypothetical protein
MGKRKQKKKQQIDLLDCYKKIRQTWEINPRTRVKTSDKKYKRSKAKQKFRRELKDQGLTD